MNETEKLLEIKKKTEKGICDYQKKISDLKSELKQLNKKIYKSCEHNWERDYSCFHDLSDKYCRKCGLMDYYIYR
jgi:hypothetical protein